MARAARSVKGRRCDFSPDIQHELMSVLRDQGERCFSSTYCGPQFSPSAVPLRPGRAAASVIQKRPQIRPASLAALAVRPADPLNAARDHLPIGARRTLEAAVQVREAARHPFRSQVLDPGCAAHRDKAMAMTLPVKYDTEGTPGDIHTSGASVLSQDHVVDHHTRLCFQHMRGDIKTNSAPETMAGPATTLVNSVLPWALACLLRTLV